MGLMRIIPKTWAELRLVTVSPPIPSIRMATSWPTRRTSANSMIVTARRGSSPLTMRALDVTKIIRRQVDRRRMRHKRTSQLSCRCSGLNELAEGLSSSQGRSHRPAHRYSLCAMRASRPSIGHRPARDQTARHTSTLLSIYRPRAAAGQPCRAPCREGPLAMIHITLHRRLSWMTACSDVRSGERGQTSRGCTDEACRPR